MSTKPLWGVIWSAWQYAMCGLPFRIHLHIYLERAYPINGNIQMINTNYNKIPRKITLFIKIWIFNKHRSIDDSEGKINRFKKYRPKIKVFTIKEISLFDFKSNLSRFLKRWPLIVKTSKMKCNKVIPQVLDENQSLFLNLSQHGQQIASDIWLIIKK